MNKIIYNGDLLNQDEPCFRCDDRGLMLGHGIFETILVRHGRMPFLPSHWQRLSRSAQALCIRLPFSEQALSHHLTTLIDANGLTTKIASARVMLTQGESARGILPASAPKPNYSIMVSEYQPAPQSRYALALSTVCRNEHSPAAKLKSISYLDNILARQQVIDRGFDEAVLLNTKQRVAECATSNIFIVSAGQILTPPIDDGALPGIMRSFLIEHSPQPIIQQSIDAHLLQQAEEIFVTNALMGIVPVTQFEDRIFHQHPTSAELSEHLQSST